MSGISSLLSIGKSALNASQVALQVTGDNIANVDTDGYSRQRVKLVNGTYTSGVDVDGVTRSYDSFVEAQYLDKISARERWSALYTGLTGVESLFNESNTSGINAAMGHKEFTLLQVREESPFLVLQSLSDPSLGLLVADPYLFLTDYEVVIGEADLRALGVDSREQVTVLVTVTIPQGMFYSAIIGSIPGQTRTAIALVTAFVANLREKMAGTYIINPAEHFEEGMRETAQCRLTAVGRACSSSVSSCRRRSAQPSPASPASRTARQQP